MERLVIGLSIALLLASALLPPAIDTFSAVDTSGWDSGVAAIWPLIPLLGIAAIALFFWRRSSRGGS